MCVPREVALVNMPFAPVERPSIQLAILQASLEAAGIVADPYFLNVDFFDLLRQHDAHLGYNSSLPSLIAEWIFAEAETSALDVQETSGAADLPWGPSPREQLAAFAEHSELEQERLEQVRQRLVPEFLRQATSATDWSRYRVVCFTVTYPQLTASLRLARTIKEVSPEVVTVFGGAPSKIFRASARELMRLYSCVDVVVVGEAEPVFAPLVQRLLAGRSPARLPGVCYRRRDRILCSRQTSALERLDQAPIPDYRPWAEKRARVHAATRAFMLRDVPIELSRGCPWAQRSPCTFCGFYPHARYRRKTDPVALAELERQVGQLGWTSFCAVDALLPRAMIDSLFAKIAARGGLSWSFVEVRADLGRAQLQRLADAGVELLQPGVEAFDDRLLRRLAKGVNLFDNLLLLKRSLELGLEVSYNLLLGIPDATDEELADQLAVLRRLAHLPPPYPLSVSFVRGSSYQRAPARFGLDGLRPDPFHRAIFGADARLKELAYELDGAWPRERQRALYERTLRWLASWRSRWMAGPRPYLWCERDGEQLVLRDGRNPRLPERVLTLEGAAAAVYSAMLDEALTEGQLQRQARGLSPPMMRAILRDLDQEELLVERADRYLGLALPRPPG